LPKKAFLPLANFYFLARVHLPTSLLYAQQQQQQQQQQDVQARGTPPQQQPKGGGTKEAATGSQLLFWIMYVFTVVNIRLATTRASRETQAV
jgi:hypothetical protein